MSDPSPSGPTAGRRATPDERSIALSLVPILRTENPHGDTLIARQRDICWREGRVDILVVNGALAGFEIKSGRDSLTRLAQQADLYGRVLDFATLVCDLRHVSKADAMLPAWWGIRSVTTASTGEPVITTLREPEQNPWVLPHDLARMLHHDELYAELAFVRGLRGISQLRRAEMAWRLVEVTELDELRRIVRQRLCQRPSWQAAASRT